MRNNYLVDNEEIVFRRANINDNLEDIAELIYCTDPFIYPFWFNNDINEAKRVLKELIKEQGFIFNYNNIYIAYDKTNNHIVGMICALDKTINLEYDYSKLETINNRYAFTIEKYIKPILEEVKNSEVMYIPNVCVKEGYRGKRIGSCLLGYFIDQMEAVGYESFGLDCLLHNMRAKNLYHSFGFKEMKLIVGFDGTDTSRVEVVSFLRKKGNYFPYEFAIKD